MASLEPFEDLLGDHGSLFVATAPRCDAIRCKMPAGVDMAPLHDWSFLEPPGSGSGPHLVLSKDAEKETYDCCISVYDICLHMGERSQWDMEVSDR